MDSGDEDNRPASSSRRQHDLDQMRSGASSPSTISTASSGSPLVRGHSKGSTGGGGGGGGIKRPAATSIAAAQLQCQQQQQQQQQGMPLKAATPIKSATSLVNGAIKGGGAAVKPEKQPKCSEENKSFGYNVAKSIAYRAYRFNEFWTLNKISYLNLACLLMTLVCLITIVLFSGNNRASPSPLSGSSGSSSSSSGQIQASAARKFQDSGDSSIDYADSLDQPQQRPPSSQPLVSGGDPKSKDEDNDEATLFDDFNLGDLRGGAGEQDSPTRKPESGAKLRRKSGPERELDEWPASPAEASELSATSSSSVAGKDNEPAGNSLSQLLEPSVEQILDSLGLAPLLRAALNETNKHRLKPTIRRTKNGATIIFSSLGSSSSNDTSGNSPLPKLLEKLMPPMLIRQSLIGGRAGSPFAADGGVQSAATTITISGRALGGAGGAPLLPPAAGLDGFGPSFLPFPGLALATGPSAAFHRSFGRGFFPEPMAMRMSALAAPDQSAAQFAVPPYPSFLGMMLRSMAADSDDDTSPPRSSSSLSPDRPRPPAVVAARANETLTAQAASTTTTTAASQSTNSSSSSGSAPVADKPATDKVATNKTQQQPLDSEVETFDVSQLAAPTQPFFKLAATMSQRVPRIQAPPPSMMVFPAPASPSSPAASFGLMSPFMAAAAPPPQMLPVGQMMVLASSSSGSDSPAAGGGFHGLMQPTIGGWRSGPPMPFNPILRAILGQLSGSPDAAASDDRNRTSRADLFADGPVGSLDQQQQQPDNDEGGQQATSEQQQQQLASESLRQMRARHRADMMADEMDSAEGDGASADFIGGGSQMFEHQPAGQIGGIIRQTIRTSSGGGPAMTTVERIFEVPSGNPFQQQQQQHPGNQLAQQVGQGIRSQSISRLVETAEANGDEPQQSQPAAKSLAGRARDSAPASERRGDDDGGAVYTEMMSQQQPPMARMSFIGRLLSDLSRQASSSSQPKPIMSSRASLQAGDSDDQDDEQMLDDNGEVRPSSADTWTPPRARIASARIRIRPFGADGVFLSPHQPPPPHMRIVDQDSLDGSELLTSGRPDGQQPQQQQQPRQAGIEDTLNSMEDRFDRVLSMAAAAAASTASQPGQLGSQRAIITPVERPRATPNAVDKSSSISTGSSNSDAKQQLASRRNSQDGENPFTSPSSPLFGFPSMAEFRTTTTTTTTSKEPEKEREASMKGHQGREPRSFTYHSNNELAASAREGQPRKEDDHHQAASESSGRASKFSPFLVAQPSGAIMGRRLDDGPFAGEQQPSIDSAADHSGAAGPAAAVTFLEGRAAMPNVHQQQQQQQHHQQESRKRFATDAADSLDAGRFRTIVV